MSNVSIVHTSVLLNRQANRTRAALEIHSRPRKYTHFFQGSLILTGSADDSLKIWNHQGHLTQVNIDGNS